MKKSISLGALALMGVLFFSSCKKDWVCECNVFGTQISVVIEDSTKKDAKAECEDESGGACTLK